MGFVMVMVMMQVKGRVFVGKGERLKMKMYLTSFFTSVTVCAVVEWVGLVLEDEGEGDWGEEVDFNF